jgi:hypothetical protein
MSRLRSLAVLVFVMSLLTTLSVDVRAAEFVVQLSPVEGKPPQYACIMGKFERDAALPLLAVNEKESGCRSGAVNEQVKPAVLCRGGGTNAPGVLGDRKIEPLSNGASRDGRSERYLLPQWEQSLGEMVATAASSAELGWKAFGFFASFGQSEVRRGATAPAQWDALKKSTHALADTKDALEALFTADNRIADHCPAYIDIPRNLEKEAKTLGIVCVSNRAADFDAGRVVLIRADGDPLTLVTLSLSGGVLQAATKDAGTISPMLQFYVAGGDYQAGGNVRIQPERRAGNGDLTHGSATLALTPLCVRRAVELPPTDAQLVTRRIWLEKNSLSESFHGDVCASADGPCNAGELSLCGTTGRCAPSRQPVVIVPTGLGKGSTIHVEIGAPGSDTRTTAAYLSAEWTEPMPPPVLKARLTSVNFSWRAGCLYMPSDGLTCPVARLPGPAIRCSAAWNKETKICSYTCAASMREQVPRWCDEGASEPADANLSNRAGPALLSSSRTVPHFEMPVDVELRVGSQRDSWREQLTFVNQQFDGFAPRSDRQFTVRQSSDLTNDRDPKQQLAVLLESRRRVRDEIGEIVRKTAVVATSTKRERTEAELRRVDYFQRGCADSCGIPCSDEAVLKYLDECASSDGYESRFCRTQTSGVQTLKDDVRVEVRSGAGNVFTLDTRAPARVSIPGTSCKDTIFYRYRSDRQSFDEREAELDAGEFRLEPPKDSYRWRWFTGRVMGGVAFEPSNERELPGVEGDDQARDLHRPFIEGELAIQLRPYGAAVQIEFPVAYMFSTKTYHPLGALAETDDAKTVAFNRVFHAPRVLGMINSDLGLGGAVGPWFGWSAEGESREVFAGIFTDFVARWLPIDGFAIDAAMRLLFLEKEQTFLATPIAGSGVSLGAGTPALFEQQEWRVMPYLGFRFFTPL